MQESITRTSRTALRNTLLHIRLSPPIDFLFVHLAERPHMKLSLEGFKFGTQRPLRAAYH